MSEIIKLVAKYKDELSGPLGRTGRRLQKFGRTAAKAATALAAVGAAVFAAAKKLAEYVAGIYDTAEATGVSVERIQALSYQFEQTGGSVDSFEKSLRGMTTFMRMADSAASEQGQVLTQLGLSYEELNAMSPDEAFITLTEALADVDNEMERMTAATTIFGGRYAQQVLGLIAETEGEVRGAISAYEDMGIALSDEQVTKLKKFDDAMTELSAEFRGFMADAIVPLLPAIKDMAEKLMVAAETAVPQLVQAIKDAMPTIMLLVDTAQLVADGWSKLTGGDMQATIDDATGAAEDLAQSLQGAVAQGLMTAEEAANAYDAELNNMLESSELTAMEAEIVREAVDDAGVGFDQLAADAARASELLTDFSKTIRHGTIVELVAMRDEMAKLSEQEGVDLSIQIDDITERLGGLTTAQVDTAIAIWEHRQANLGLMGSILNLDGVIQGQIDRLRELRAELQQAETEGGDEPEAAPSAGGGGGGPDSETLAALRAIENSHERAQLAMISAREDRLERVRELANEEADVEISAASRAAAQLSELNVSRQEEESRAWAQTLRMIQVYGARVQEALAGVEGMFQSFYSYRSQAIQQDKDEAIESAEKQLEARQAEIQQSTMSEEQKRTALAEAQAKYREKVDKLNTKYDEKEKEAKAAMKPIKVADAISNVALGVTEALAAGPPPWNFIQAGLVAAAGAAEVATVSAQKYAQGGLVEGVGGQDTVPAMLTPGEFVLTPKQTKGMLAGRLGGGKSKGAVINLTYSPTLSTASPGEAIRLTDQILRHLRRGGVDI